MKFTRTDVVGPKVSGELLRSGLLALGGAEDGALQRSQQVGRLPVDAFLLIHGTGSNFYAPGVLETFARAQGMHKLWVTCHEGEDHSIRFLEKAGFGLIGQRFESILDLTTFDESRFGTTIERLQAAPVQSQGTLNINLRINAFVRAEAAK